MSEKNILDIDNCALSFSDALTIGERINLYKMLGIYNYDYTQLERWVNIKGLMKEKEFDEMLDVEGISKDDFNRGLKKLNDQDRNLLKNEVLKSDWFVFLKKAIESYNENVDKIRENTKAYDLSLSISPFLMVAFSELTEITKELKNIEIDKDILPKLLDKVSASLFAISSKTLIWELHNNKANNLIEGSDPEERFKDFISKNFVNTEDILSFYSKYPVLARRISTKCIYLITHFKELLTRLDNSFFEICQALDIPFKNNKIINLNCNEGDTHQQGRFVVKIELENNINLVYKPRNLRVQQKFSSFIDWFNKNSNLLELKVNKAFYHDDYTFEGFIEYKECESENQVKSYYERIGEICALVYILRGNDIHYENIIANVEYPVIIDIETLFQHQTDLINFPENALSIAYKECIDSVAGTGLLPIMAFANGKNKKGMDLSGLNGDSQVIPYKLLGIVDANKDSMRFEYQEFTIKGANNIPKINGAKVSFKNYIPFIIKGFENAMSFIVAHKMKLSEEGGVLSIFKGIKIRHLLKATQNYAKLNEFSSHPNYTQDMIKMERLFSNAWAYNYKDKRSIKFEVEDMINDDIPIFYGIVDNKDLISSRGVVIENYFALSSYEKVINKIKALSEGEVKKQIAHMIATLGIYEDICEKRYSKSRDLSMSVCNYDLFHRDREMLLEEAKVLAERIMKEAIWDKKGQSVNWNNVLYDDINVCWKVRPLDGGLYNGLSGVLLFLYELEKICGEKKYTHTINTILKTIIESPMSNPLISNSISAYYGTVSALYPLTVMYADSKDPELYSHIFKIAAFVNENLDQVQMLDWISGYAGLIKVMMNLYKLTDEELYFNIAEKSVNKLMEKLDLQNRDNLRTGMAHGLSGIALSLYEFNEVKNDSMLTNYINSLLDLEDDILCNRNNNSTTWCNGTSGLLLSRLQLKDLPSNETAFKAALNYLKQNASTLKDDDCLCHGNMGDLELVLEAYKLTADTDVKDIINTKLSQIFERKNALGDFNYNTIEGYTNIGLFMGLSGIGYVLLRLYDAKQVPNVLNLEIWAGDYCCQKEYLHMLEVQEVKNQIPIS